MAAPAQQSIGLNTPKVDISRFVQWNEYPEPRNVRVGGCGGRRSGQIGMALGNVALKHAGGYEIVVLFPDGKVESFAPLDLFPEAICS